jgi:hypothetical protein
VRDYGSRVDLPCTDLTQLKLLNSKYSLSAKAVLRLVFISVADNSRIVFSFVLLSQCLRLPQTVATWRQHCNDESWRGSSYSSGPSVCLYSVPWSTVTRGCLAATLLNSIYHTAAMLKKYDFFIGINRSAFNAQANGTKCRSRR